MTSHCFAHIDRVDQTDSTNDDLVEIARTDPDTPRVLIADEQLAGRGRRDRTWVMPAGGGLLMSFYVPWRDSETSHIVPTALGNAAIDAIKQLSCEIHLKWPNDIVAGDDRKVGGMLSSAVLVDGELVGVVAGLGINVSWPTEPVEELPDAVALNSLIDEPADRDALANAIIEGFDIVLSTAQTYGVVPIHDRYRRHCRTLGSTVRIDRGDGELIGTATDIDPSGALVVDVDGHAHRVEVGDVHHLRPVD